MEPFIDDNRVQAKISARAEQLYAAHRQSICARTDTLFAWLMVLQWLGGIAAALWISPRTWTGTASEIHVHVWVAILLGGLVASLPIALAVTRPGSLGTRHVMAFAQMLFSASPRVPSAA